MLGVVLAPAVDGAVEALRTAGRCRTARCCVRAKKGGCDCCGSFAGRVHVEKGAAPVEHGAKTAGG